MNGMSILEYIRIWDTGGSVGSEDGYEFASTYVKKQFPVDGTISEKEKKKIVKIYRCIIARTGQKRSNVEYGSNILPPEYLVKFVHRKQREEKLQDSMPCDERISTISESLLAYGFDQASIPNLDSQYLEPQNLIDYFKEVDSLVINAVKQKVVDEKTFTINDCQFDENLDKAEFEAVKLVSNYVHTNLKSDEDSNNINAVSKQLLRDLYKLAKVIRDTHFGTVALFDIGVKAVEQKHYKIAGKAFDAIKFLPESYVGELNDEKKYFCSLIEENKVKWINERKKNTKVERLW